MEIILKKIDLMSKLMLLDVNVLCVCNSCRQFKSVKKRIQKTNQIVNYNYKKTNSNADSNYRNFLIYVNYPDFNHIHDFGIQYFYDCN